MTIAEEIAEELEHDPERFETRKRGVSLETLCERHQGRLELAVRETNDDGVTRHVPGEASDHRAGDPVRHVFPDGSAIVEHGSRWVIDGQAPFSILP